jgi:SAM-dependent methyltransferase
MARSAPTPVALRPSVASPSGRSHALLDLLGRNEAALPHYSAYVLASALRHLPRSLEPAANVLDFGCGIGTFAELIRAETGARPDTVEPDPALRAILRKRGFEPCACLRETGRLYDVILCINVLEHIEDDEAALRELYAALKSGGMLVLYVPAFRLLWSAMDDLAGHQRRYRRSELERRVNGCGFRIVASRYCDALGFLASLLYRVVARAGRPPSLRALWLYDRVGVPVTRILDGALYDHLGKNVLICATKPAAGSVR